MIKVSFTTLGCKTNHYDSDLMAALCRRAGFKTVSGDCDADVHVINTCTVTTAADAQGRNLIRRLIKSNPDSLIIVCGCSSQVDPGQFWAIEGVHHVLGVEAGADLIRVLRDNFKIDEKKEGRFSIDQSRARALLKIQDGCEKSCTYCLVRKARGKSRSMQEDEILKESRLLIKKGFREIVLTGVHIGYYGRDRNPPSSLKRLLCRLIEETDDCRFRVSSLNPDELDKQMIDIFSHPRICSHLHLSLQSGADEILTMMNRKAGIKNYAKMIEMLKLKIPDAALGADIIVGFPGETLEHYHQTLNFIKVLPFTYLHVFPFSPRPQTKAASLRHQVPEVVRKQRVKELKSLSLKKRRKFYESQLGQTLDVVVISKRPSKEGFIKGMSHNYIPVYIKNKKAKYRELICCNVKKLLPGEEGVAAL